MKMNGSIQKMSSFIKTKVGVQYVYMNPLAWKSQHA